jgi:PKD repeat protein
MNTNKALSALMAAIGAFALALSAADAGAVVGEPTDVIVGSPPIQTFPAAGETPPPADVISDPLDPTAACGSWFLETRYAGIWSTSSSWWEYECTYAEVIYPWCHDLPGMCDAGYWILGSWTDRFYWNGSQPVFYGENYQFGCDAWWDAAAGAWFATASCSPSDETPPNAAPAAGFGFNCVGLSCSFDGAGSADSDGTIQTYAWTFGDGTQAAGSSVTHAYGQSGTYSATLTVTDDDGASAAVSKDVVVTNAAPTARFTLTCSSLTCSFDAGASTDGDGTIDTYVWSFGDGSMGSGKTVGHTYGRAGNYTVALTVTDNGGASAGETKTVAPMAVSARGYKANGVKKVDLAWIGPSGTSFDIYRDGAKIATLQASVYTDSIAAKGSGTYTYKVCAAAGFLCSNDAKVVF